VKYATNTPFRIELVRLALAAQINSPRALPAPWHNSRLAQHVGRGDAAGARKVNG
jgi:hypothetical protein